MEQKQDKPKYSKQRTSFSLSKTIMHFDETKIELWRWEGRGLESKLKDKCWDQDTDQEMRGRS